jgi:hypothetical protein
MKRNRKVWTPALTSRMGSRGLRRIEAGVWQCRTLHPRSASAKTIRSGARKDSQFHLENTIASRIGPRQAQDSNDVPLIGVIKRSAPEE